MDHIKAWRPPAITTGLIPFYLILAALTNYDTLKLTPDALFTINLNRLSFYPLVFASPLHLVLGILLFTPLCGWFELRNGTVRTGIVLNVVAVIPGVLCNLIAKLSSNRLASADFCGTTSWMAAFAAFLSVSTWSLPVLPVGNVIFTIPAWILPTIAYIVFSIIAPQYLIVHGLALAMGYGLGLLYLGFLVDGTTNPVEWIESKLEGGIKYLRYIVRFIGEIEARELRRGSLVTRRRAMEASDDIPMPAASLTNPVA